MYNRFTYYTPTKVLFGSGTEMQTGEMVRSFGGTKALVVYGGGSAVKSGLLGRVSASLADSGIGCVSLGGVVPNPHLSLVYEGIALGKAENVDFLLAVGGGSVIDTAKAIAYGLAEPEHDVWELYTHERVPCAALPVGAVLTIAAAGSEMSNSSVITNEKTGEKRGCNHDIIRPRFAIMNPDLTKTLPDYQTEAGCVDIMMHTMERYFTNGGNREITDALAEGLLRTVMKYARILHEDPQDEQARAEVMWASSLAHNGLTGCGNDGGDFACHLLEHELSGMFGVTHGPGLSAIWPTWARYVMDSCMHRFVQFAVNVMGVEPAASDRETAMKGVEAMVNFYHEIDMPATLAELGVNPTQEQIERMADGAHRACGGERGSAKKLHREDFAAIYAAARQ